MVLVCFLPFTAGLSLIGWTRGQFSTWTVPIFLPSIVIFVLIDKLNLVVSLFVLHFLQSLSNFLLFLGAIGLIIDGILLEYDALPSLN